MVGGEAREGTGQVMQGCVGGQGEMQTLLREHWRPMEDFGSGVTQSSESSFKETLDAMCKTG